MNSTAKSSPKRLALWALVCFAWALFIIPGFMAKPSTSSNSLPLQAKIQVTIAGKLARMHDCPWIPLSVRQQLQSVPHKMLDECAQAYNQNGFIVLCEALELMHRGYNEQALTVLDAATNDNNKIAIIFNTTQDLCRSRLHKSAQPRLTTAQALMLQETINSELSDYFITIANRQLERCALLPEQPQKLSSNDLNRVKYDILWLTLVFVTINLNIFLVFGYLLRQILRFRRHSASQTNSTDSAGEENSAPDVIANSEMLPAPAIASESTPASELMPTSEAERPSNADRIPACNPTVRFDPLYICSAYVGVQWLMMILAILLSHVFNFESSVVVSIFATYLGVYTLLIVLLAFLLPRLKAVGSAPVPSLRHALQLEWPRGRALLWGWGGFAAAMVMTSLLTQLVTLISGHTPFSENPFLGIAANSHPSEWFLLLMQLSILGPFFEEILFRGILFGGLRTAYPTWIAAAVSAFLFGATHFDPQGTVILIGLGLCFAFIYHKSQNLWSAIIAHGLWNGYIGLNILFLS